MPASLESAASTSPNSPAAGPRRRRREATEGDILRVAREHLAEHGAAALSLRAIARDLGMVSSGIYRYVASRDELLTRLIVDSYTSLADTVRSRHEAVPTEDLEGRWDAIADAVRCWARDHPHDFALLYGSPVPDYAAPPERTTPAGTAVPALLLALLDDVGKAHRLAPTLLHRRTPDEAARAGAEAEAAVCGLFDEDFFVGSSIDATALTQGLAAWTLLVGAVTSEVFEQLGPQPRPDALFAILSATARSLVISPAGGAAPEPSPEPDAAPSTGVSTAGYTA